VTDLGEPCLELLSGTFDVHQEPPLLRRCLPRKKTRGAA
jgi:hypothetical protein